VWRFALVGVANTAVDLGLFTLLHGQLGIVVANLVSTSAGMTLSFLANSRFTFRTGRPTRSQALRFVACTATTLWLLQPAVILLVHHEGSSVPAAKGAALVVSVATNFLLYRSVVWNERRLTDETRNAGRGAARAAGRR
jgi:putative flippase GtrA